MATEISALLPFARASRTRTEAARCELCAAPIGEPHPHVVAIAERRLRCACGACAVLFRDPRAGGGRYRTVPDRVLTDDTFAPSDADWQRVGVPVRLAFLARGGDGRWTAFCPSPAGPVEAELSDEGARALVELAPLAASVEPDVEGLLVHRARGGRAECLLVPIDVCYELAGVVRRSFRGFDGGDEARAAIEERIARLRKRALPFERSERAPRGGLGGPPLSRRFPMSLDRARAVADAVLFEGYALYPYRPSSTKNNRLRFQFGVLAPRAVAEATSTDPWWMETQCLVAGAPKVAGTLRFLRVRRRRIESEAGEPLGSLEVGGKLLVPWDEGEVREIEIDGENSQLAVDLPGDRDEELVREGDRAVARVVRTRAPLSLRIETAREPVAGGRATRVRIRVENRSPIAAAAGPRDETLIAATLGTHLLLAVDDGEFLSLTDPPAWAEIEARNCKNVGTWPVLAGAPGDATVLLSAPIILYDHPQVAPESPGDLFDATEIDEILTLRTLLLTDEEKREARATDPHVAAILDRVDGLAPASWDRLHGTFRDPDPAGAIQIGEANIVPGSRVVLRPGARRTDAQDMFLAGRRATVREIKRDVDGRDCLAVTIDEDPAADLHLWHGRFHYFYADEVEPVVEAED